jgi:pilus assembly protein CpaF
MASQVHRSILDGDEVDPPTRDQVTTMVRTCDPLAPVGVVQAAVERVNARVEGLGPLEPLLADPAVTEVMVNGGCTVWVERHGELARSAIEIDAVTTMQLIERVVSPLGLRVDRSSPLVDARLADGSRIHAVLPPLAVDGPCLTIRRFGARPIPVSAMASPAVTSLLLWAVGARCNVVVSGGTGAGKTTLLNGLARAIPAGERVVTIEETAELQLDAAHVVRLEARPANAEGIGGVSVRTLVRNALRMRPDRIVVGECRSGETLDMLQAMNTGHEGSLSTCHANSSLDALRRLETMVLMGDVALPHAVVREQVAAAVDLVVHLERRPGGARRVASVAEVVHGDGSLSSRPNRPGDGTDAAPDRFGGGAIRPLVHGDSLVALPTRWRDRRAAGPDPDWLSR